MEKLAYDVHVDPDDEYEKGTCEDDESDGHDDRDDNDSPDSIGGQPQPLLDIQYIYKTNLEHEADKGEEGVVNLLYVKTEYEISSEKRTVKYHNI